tara:strand:+ start:119 stop:1150 length:1032 start_codon:yes stop_codon:yes gene_type:complete
MSKKQNLIAVGADDGFFNTKVYLGEGNQIIIPSRARLGAAKRISLMGDNDSVITSYKTNDMVYTVGASESEQIVHDEYPMSDLNRVIVHHALRQAGLGGKDVAMFTGLPLKKYYTTSSQSKNEKLIARKEANFNQQIFVNDQPNEFTANIKLHKVGPEAASLLYDYVIEEVKNKDGFIEHQDRIKHQIAVIDIGGRTTDICIIDQGDVALDTVETINAGMHNIYDALKDYARDELSLDRVPDSIIDRMFTNGVLKVGARDRDVSDIITNSKAMVASNIIQAVNNKIGSKAKMLDAVLFIGGGSEVLAQQLMNSYDNEFTVKDPVMANARSFYKAMKCGILPNI